MKACRGIARGSAKRARSERRASAGRILDRVRGGEEVEHSEIEAALLVTGDAPIPYADAAAQYEWDAETA